MGDYKPIFTETEHEQVDALMERLKQLHALEDRLKQELRKLLYKTENS